MPSNNGKNDVATEAGRPGRLVGGCERGLEVLARARLRGVGAGVNAVDGSADDVGDDDGL